MDANEILEHIRTTFDGLDLLSTPDVEFVYADASIPHDRRQPFVTILRTDAGEHTSDRASDLAARGAFRVNLGVTRETYRAMFGPEPAWGPGGGVVETGHDFTKLDTLLPHPIYAPMSWICIVSPSVASWPRLRELLDESYEKAKRSKRASSVGDA